MRLCFVLILSIFLEVVTSLPGPQSISAPTTDNEGGANLTPTTNNAEAKEGGPATESLYGNTISNIDRSGLFPQPDDETSLSALQTDCSSDPGTENVTKRKLVECKLTQAAPATQGLKQGQNPTTVEPDSTSPNPKSDIDQDSKNRATRKLELSPNPASLGKGPVKGIMCPVWRVPLTQPLCCTHKPLPLGVMVFGCILCMCFHFALFGLLCLCLSRMYLSQTNNSFCADDAAKAACDFAGHIFCCWGFTVSHQPKSLSSRLFSFSPNPLKHDIDFTCV